MMKLFIMNTLSLIRLPLTFVIICALMVEGLADTRTDAENKAYRELYDSYIEGGRHISFAECVEKILRHSGATDDFQDFTKVLDPETNSTRLVDHLQGKVSTSISLLCENKIISLVLAIVLLITVIIILIFICLSICC